MYAYLFTFLLIILTAFILVKKPLNNFLLSLKKKKLEKYFDLKEFKENIEAFNKKETFLIFHCEKLISKYYSKLIIFNTEYNLNENDIIKIKVEKAELMKSDFTENLTLKSEKEEVNFIINIIYHMNNHYQIILDKSINYLSLELVIYSKQNKFPKIITKNALTFKDYKDNEIPNLKRYNLINISKDDFYTIYHINTLEKLDEKNIFLLQDYYSLFVNFIHKDKDKYEGKIFVQKEDLIEKEFTEKEMALLNEVKKLIDNCTKNKTSRLTLFLEYKKLVEKNKDSVTNIVNKITSINFFQKYYNQIIEDKILDLMDIGYFIFNTEKKEEIGINKFLEYIEYKKKIFLNENEFNDFEKLMISISLPDSILNYDHPELIKLYDLPADSPFMESEKIYLDIIKKIDENSSLYFFYLQINSSSGIDYKSLNSWYKIRFIPLIEIQAHLLYNRYQFFFIYERSSNISAFVNPQSLIISFNVSSYCGYNFKKSLVYEKNENNATKLLVCKFHENVHSKFNVAAKNDYSPRYLYNSELNPLDTHFDTIFEYKNGIKPNDSERKGEDVGEEGYGIEMFLYGNLAMTDILKKSYDDLKQFNNVNLYIKDNFKELNILLIGLLSKQIIHNNYFKKEKQLNEFSLRNSQKKKPSADKTIEAKSPSYYFHNYSIESRY